MDQGFDDAASDLAGPRAVRWLFRQRNGGHFVDGALQAVIDAFGSEEPVSAFAPLGRDQEPTDFFLAVTGDVDNDEDWERFVAAHLVLSRHAAQIEASQARRADPFGRFHLVVQPSLVQPVPAESAMRFWGDVQ